MRLHKWLGWLAASLTLAWAGLELSAPHEPAVMAIVEDEYVTGAGYAAVSDQVASMLGGGDLKVTPEVVERIKRLRRLGRRFADIAQLCGLSEPTLRKVVKRATTKESATYTQEPRRK